MQDSLLHSKRKAAGLSEYLHAVVLAVTNQNVSIWHDSDSFQPFEFAFAGTPRAECSQETAVGMENLNSVVAWISDANVSLVIDSNTSAKTKWILCFLDNI